MNLTQSLEQQAKPNLTFDLSQRLMALVDQRKECVVRIDKMAKDFRALIEELKRIQRQIKGIGGGYRAKVAWTVTPEFRFNWKAIACVALVLSVTSAFAQPRPIPSAITNYPRDVYPLTILWQYTNPVPAATVLIASTNALYLIQTNVPAVLGTNRVTILLPSTQWSITAYAIEGAGDISRTSRLNVARSAQTFNVAAIDGETKSNRLIYTGPKMPGKFGTLKAWTEEGWQTK